MYEMHAYGRMSFPLLPVSGQPLKGPLHLELHVLGGIGAGRERQPADGPCRHLHHRHVIGGQQVPEVVGEAGDSCAGVAHIHSYQAYCKQEHTFFQCRPCRVVYIDFVLISVKKSLSVSFACILYIFLFTKCFLV